MLGGKVLVVALALVGLVDNVKAVRLGAFSELLKKFGGGKGSDPPSEAKAETASEKSQKRFWQRKKGQEAQQVRHWGVGGQTGQAWNGLDNKGPVEVPKVGQTRSKFAGTDRPSGILDMKMGHAQAAQKEAASAFKKNDRISLGASSIEKEDTGGVPSLPSSPVPNSP